MAGIQSCCRRLLVVGTSRIICKNGVLHQPSRGRHHLVFQVSLLRNSLNLKKSRINFNGHCIYRLASTNTTEGKDVQSPEVQKPASNATSSGSETASGESVNSGVVIDEASLPPVPSTEIDTPALEFITTGLGEPSIKSLGLGSWYPSGMAQQCLEFFHVNFDLPWWGAIATLTVILRIMTFPVTLSSKRESQNMINNMPYISQYQMKINEAKRNGDYFTAATLMQDLQQFLVDKKIKMFSLIKPMLFQTPFFLSMFWGLKGMAAAPVESFKTQGVLWFTDLTACDPYYILPIILGTSMYAVIMVGAEGVSLKAVNNKALQLILRGMPVVVFAISTQFSACIVWYWTVSNVAVLCQTSLLKIPRVGEFLQIPKVIKHDESVFPQNKKGFIEDFKEGLANAKITREVEERERLNTLTFEKAGSSAIPRTFKHNPKLAKASKAVAK